MNRLDSWLIPIIIFIWGLLTKKQKPKILCYCPFKILWTAKNTLRKKYIISSYSTAKNMPKIAEVKLSTCGLEIADCRTNCDCQIAELRLRSNIFFKSCWIAIAEVLPSSCETVIMDSTKGARAHLWLIKFLIQKIRACVYNRYWPLRSMRLQFKYLWYPDEKSEVKLLWTVPFKV